MDSSEEDEAMQSDSIIEELPLIFNLSWEDIWLAEILPMLTLEDLFRLRGSCQTAYQLVNIYFSQIKKLDITNRRTFNLESYQVQMLAKIASFCHFGTYNNNGLCFRLLQAMAATCAI